MDLILVMKERLRDQSSETRRVMRWYLNLTLAGVLLISTGFYIHPAQHLFGTMGAGTRQEGEGSSSAAAATDAAVHSSSSHSGKFASFLFIVGHVLLQIAVRSLSDLSRVYRGTGGWQNRVQVEGAASPQQRQTTGSPSTTPATNASLVPKYAFEFGFFVLTLSMADRLVSFAWLAVLQVAHWMLFAHVSYRAIAASP